MDHGICVVEPASTRVGVYVAMTRGRDRNVAWIVDHTGLEDPEEAFAATIARPPNASAAHAVRDQLQRAAGVTLPERATQTPLPEDPARRMVERLNRLTVRPRPAPRLSR